MSHSVTSTRTILAKIYLGIDGALANDCATWIQSGQHDQKILEIEPPDPNGYDDWRAFFRDYATASLCSKFEKLELGVNRSKVAIDKFLLCEEHCRLINKKFRHPEVDPEMDPTTLAIFHRARRKIGRVLGRFDWDEAVPLMAFGPGASVGLPRKRSHVVDKFGFQKPTVTGECATLAELLIGSSPQWSSTVPVTSGRTEDCFSIVRGSRVTTVPKNAKTDRVIAIEPLMNMYVQKGIGALIRRRLRTVGVNLDDQTRNQLLARKGSADGSLATIDLSSASDSVSLGLVEWLVPPDWVLAMKICRSIRSVLPSGEEVLLQKFSSMGNGFTFELESLVFWALCSACLQFYGESVSDLGVYGDDLIVPTLLSGRVIDVLSEAGFTTNKEKTFVIGPFRESCGKHFFRGHDVTPLYVRKDISGEEMLLWAANGIRRLAHRMVGYDYGCCSGLHPAYKHVVRALPDDLRKLSIPEGFGDGGLVRDFDESHPRRHRCYDAYVTRHLTRVYSSFVPSGQAVLTTALFFLERRVSQLRDRFGFVVGGEVPLRKPTQRYRLRVVKLVVPQWCGLGPWVDSFSRRP